MRMLAILFLLISFVGKAQKNYSLLLDNYMKAQANVNEFSGGCVGDKRQQSHL